MGYRILLINNKLMQSNSNSYDFFFRKYVGFRSVGHPDDISTSFNIENSVHEDDDNEQYNSEILIYLNDLLNISRAETLLQISKSRSVTPVSTDCASFASCSINKSLTKKSGYIT